MAETEPFPWAHVMQLGLSTLGLSPQEFWRCTLRELTTALGPATRPLQRQNLDELMRQWPDSD